MKTPTPAQTAVLDTLHAQSAAISSMLTDATHHQQNTGTQPPASWYEDFHGRSVLREALTDASHAAALPRSWIDHARTCGENNQPWRGSDTLPAPEPANLDRVLGDLTANAHRLRDWVTLDAVYSRPDTNRSPHLRSRFDRNLHALHYRTNAVANLLGLGDQHGTLLWGTSQDWITEGTQTLNRLSADQLAERWRTATRADTRSYGLQTVALAGADIPIGTSSALPDLDYVKQSIAAATDLPRDLNLSAGADIAAAIHATTPGLEEQASGSGVQPPIFSAAVGTTLPAAPSATNRAQIEATGLGM
ncbi:hypothetical protein [Nocardia carnea]|uniref:hypothetical protein n=1 Tax=Nocardia carnea TaxID=37328 RepID=UPI002454623E|nr:hypothetical protein [Nocardia carnea]